MNVFSYHTTVPDLDIEAELRLSVLWVNQWSAAGFNPIILNEWTAAKHPFYKEFVEATSNLPTSNPQRYENACRLRWLALAVEGGGFLSDLDVMPMTSKAEIRQALGLGPTGANFVTVYQAPCCPAFSYASADNALRLCQEFAKGIGNSPQGDRSHISDQYAIEQLVKGGADWVQVRDIVKQYPDDGWELAPLVHFPNAALGPRNLTPRWKHIPNLLKRL